MNNNIAWATGLFEGEGSIFLHPTCASVCLSMTQTDVDILYRLQQLFGGSIGPKNYRAKPAHYKPQFQWKLQRAKEVRSILEQMLPLLGERRACKALDALDNLDKI
tara:strand:+ start:354 stop:671 length:318 start_codon:yes stop_codon:yes gene_type:complete